MIEEETVEKLRVVAGRVSPLMPLLITLMDSTGRRLSSVLGLRWDDFDFEKQTITWRAELDKKRRTWIVPMPKQAEVAILEYRSEHPAIGSALVFPMMREPTKAVTRHLASDWMHRAYRYAGIKRPKGSLWHAVLNAVLNAVRSTVRRPYYHRAVHRAGTGTFTGTSTGLLSTSTGISGSRPC